MGDLVSLKARADKRRAEVERVTTIEREESMFGKLKPLFTLFFTGAGRKLYRAAVDAVRRTAQESLLHRDWTADDRRAYAIMVLKEELGEEFPASSWLVNLAIEYAYSAIRGALKKASSR